MRNIFVFFIFSLISTQIFSQNLVVDDFSDGPFSLMSSVPGDPGDDESAICAEAENGCIVDPSTLLTLSSFASVGRDVNIQNLGSGGSWEVILDTASQRLQVGRDNGVNGIMTLFYANGDSSGPSDGSLNYVAEMPNADPMDGLFLLTPNTTLATEIISGEEVPVIVTVTTTDDIVYTQDRTWVAGSGLEFPWNQFREAAIVGGNPVPNPEGTIFDKDTKLIRNISFTFVVSEADFILTGIGVGRAPEGETPTRPVLPEELMIDGVSVFQFTDGESRKWYDPPTALGYDYEMVSDSLFTSITFPPDFESMELLVEDVSLGIFQGGDTVIFLDYFSELGSLLESSAGGFGVSSFKVRGLMTDASAPDAFPLFMVFNTLTASFTQTPIIAMSIPTFGYSAGIAFAVILVLIGVARTQKQN